MPLTCGHDAYFQYCCFRIDPNIIFWRISVCQTYSDHLISEERISSNKRESNVLYNMIETMRSIKVCSL